MNETGNILLVDDDAAIRTVVTTALRRGGYNVTSVDTLAAMHAAMEQALPDILVTDVVLPDGDGLDHVPDLVARYPDLPIIVLSARNTLSTAVRANAAGAFEYLPKPFDLDELSRTIASALARSRPAPEQGEEGPEDSLPLIGRDPAMQEVYRIIARVVSNDLTVLVFGESGTGKELVARAIHDLGARRNGPFVALNMAAIPRELIEAELFGHERGAFTGAQARVAGKFEQAAGGTLFLDEIGDMPIDAQTRLLRVLQAGEFTTVGGARVIRSDVRVIAATNRELVQLVQSGQFREDLYYRLNVVPIELPPLRERRQDIGLLARHFLERAAEEGLPRRRLSVDALRSLEARDWPGNVRELENLMRRLAVLGRDVTINVAEVTNPSIAVAPQAEAARTPDISEAILTRLRALQASMPSAFEDGSLYDRIIHEVERPLIEAMLERSGHNQLRAAQMLGINRNTLRKKIEMLDIRRDDGR